jgi:protein ImuB
MVSDTLSTEIVSDTISVERIESGWWDGRDVRRDYCVVVGSAGEKLWFYRDCVTQEWYLHGIFG